LCFMLRDFYLQHEGLHGGLSTERERSSMLEDAPATLNMVVDNVSWELFEERFQERYLSEEFIKRHLNKFDTLRQGSRMVTNYKARLELLRYAPHQITQKLKVKKFEFGLIVRIQLLLRVPGILDRRKFVRWWGATLPSLFPKGKGRSIWISRTPYHGSFGQGPSDSCSSE
jgi:hypothetical protein